VIEDLIEHGAVTEPWIGAEYQEINSDLAEHLGIEAKEGLLVSDISKDSPADKAGLKRGDIVVKIDNQTVRTIEEATIITKSLQSGKKVIFQILRDGESLEIEVEVGSAETAGMARAWSGLVVQEPTPESAKKYGLSSYKRGVLVVRVDNNSPADAAGLERGDRIIGMTKEIKGRLRRFRNDSGQDINKIDDFKKFISSVQNGQRIGIIFERGRRLWQTHLTASKN